MRDHLLPAGIRGGVGPIGWHSFRHSYSTLFCSLQVDLKVQQELLRHSDIRATMNIYTQAVPDAGGQQSSRRNGSSEEKRGMKKRGGKKGGINGTEGC